jgi:hypothetical protein
MIIFEWSCPLWVSFALGTVVFLPLSSFISFRVLLWRASTLQVRRHDD